MGDEVGYNSAANYKVTTNFEKNHKTSVSNCSYQNKYIGQPKPIHINSNCNTNAKVLRIEIRIDKISHSDVARLQIHVLEMKETKEDIEWHYLIVTIQKGNCNRCATIRDQMWKHLQNIFPKWKINKILTL